MFQSFRLHSTYSSFERSSNWLFSIRYLKKSSNSQRKKVIGKTLISLKEVRNYSKSTTSFKATVIPDQRISLQKEQQLRSRLVDLYLEEDNSKLITPEHWTRSETELNWLKLGANKYLVQNSSSLQHLSNNQKLSLDLILLGWVDQYVSQKKPLAYILGDIPFGDMVLSVRPPILIPRSETEEWVIKLSKRMTNYFRNNKHPSIPTLGSNYPSTSSTNTHVKISNSKYSASNCFKVLDIGTGSGCISNYLAYHHRYLHAVGIDIHQDAIHLARGNASIHRLNPSKSYCSSSPSDHVGRSSFFNLDLFSPTFTKNLLERSQTLMGFDMIISNPPYITHSNYLNLPTSVKHWESPIALIGDRKFTPIHSLPSLSRGNLPTGEYGFFTSSYPSSSSSSPNHPYFPLESKESQHVVKSHQINSNKTNGTDFYERIIHLISQGSLLRTTSASSQHQGKCPLPKIVFEVGDNLQARLIRNIILLRLAPHIISHVEIWKDYSGIERTVLAY